METRPIEPFHRGIDRVCALRADPLLELARLSDSALMLYTSLCRRPPRPHPLATAAPSPTRLRIPLPVIECPQFSSPPLPCVSTATAFGSSCLAIRQRRTGHVARPQSGWVVCGEGSHSGWDGADRRSSSGSPSPLRSPAACPLRALRAARISIAGLQRAPELSRVSRGSSTLNHTFRDPLLPKNP
jgi:hypothetical protein